MSALEIIDESFDKDYCENYELSIQTCLNGFSVAVKDTVRNLFIALVDYPFDTISNSEGEWQVALDSFLATYPWLRGTFKKVIFNFKNAPFSIVPKELFSEADAKSILLLTNDVPNLYELHYHSFSVAQPEAVVIFALPSELVAGWMAVQPKTKFVSPVAQFNPSSYGGIGSDFLLIDAKKDWFTVVYNSNSKVVAINTFEYKTTTDFAYFVLGFCNSLKLDSRFIGIKLTGEAQNSDEVVSLLSNYFSLVSTDIIYKNALFAYSLMKHRAKFFSLFNLDTQCV